MFGAPFGTRTWGQPAGARAAFSPAFPYPYALISAARRCRIIITGRYGNLLGEVVNFDTGRVTRSIEEAASIELTVPETEAVSALLTRPNRIAIYDVVGALIETFVIQQEWSDNQSGGLIYGCKGFGLISLLSRERLSEDYAVLEDDVITGLQVVNAMLALQLNSPAIRRGRIDAQYKALVVAVSARQGDSVLSVLEQLSETYGGYVWVDNVGRLNWTASRKSLRSLTATYGENLLWLKPFQDNTQAATRVYYYGKRTGDRYLTLKDAGEDEEYLQAGSAAINRYGIVSAFKVDSEVEDPAALLLRAQQYLVEVAEPEKTYEAGLIDQSHCSEWGYNQTLRVDPGVSITFYDDRLEGGNIERQVLSVTQDLKNPAAVDVLFGRLEDSMLDVLSGSPDAAASVIDIPLPSDVTPSEIGDPPGPGVSSDYSRDDHSHEYDPGTIFDPNNQALLDAMQTLIDQAGSEIGVPQPGDNIQPVGETTTSGSGSAFARDAHIHKGNHFTAPDKASIDDTEVGSDWITTDTNRKYCVVANGAVECLSALE